MAKRGLTPTTAQAPTTRARAAARRGGCHPRAVREVGEGDGAPCGQAVVARHDDAEGISQHVRAEQVVVDVRLRRIVQRDHGQVDAPGTQLCQCVVLLGNGEVQFHRVVHGPEARHRARDQRRPGGREGGEAQAAGLLEQRHAALTLQRGDVLAHSR